MNEGNAHSAGIIRVAFTDPAITRIKGAKAPAIPPARFNAHKLIDELAKPLLMFISFTALFVVFVQIIFLFKEASGIFADVSIGDFLFGDHWNPTGNPPSFGIFPLVVGTLLVTIGAMMISIPLGIAVAIYLSEIAPIKWKSRLKGFIELLSGIPSVVFGLFGLVFITDMLRIAFNKPSGQSWLAGSIVLGIMSLPTVITLSEDALKAVPNRYREASLSLGANKWQTIIKVIVPAAAPGISTAIILGMGRAIGETMAVMMVTGNTPIIPEPLTDIFSPIRTITATIGIETPETAVGSAHYHALFALVIMLFFISILLNFIAERSVGKMRARLNPEAAASEKGDRHKRRFLMGSIRVKASQNTAAGSESSVNVSNKPRGKFTMGLIGKRLSALAVLAMLSWVMITWFSPLFGIPIVLIIIVIRYYYHRRADQMIKQKISFTFIYTATIITILSVLLTVGFIVYKGLPAINFKFLLYYPGDLGRKGGIAPAIIGTFLLVFGAIIIAVPFGIGAGIYLSEYAKQNKVTRIINVSIDILNGTPSIVFGMFGFIVFSIMFEWGKSLIAGQITLALMILPTIIKNTEESLRSVPSALREASLALGATKWYTIRKVVLPAASKRILTGVILSMGRAAGETAPIMFTAAVFSQRRLPHSIFDPVMALPYHIFILATTVPGGTENAFGAALVLLVIVGLFYGIAIKIRGKLNRAGGSSFVY